MTWDGLSLGLIVAAAVPANLFPILYTVWKNWWHSSEARHLFFFVTGLAALIDLYLIRYFFGDFELYGLLRTTIYAVICYQLYRRLWLLVKYNSPLGERRQAGRAATMQAQTTQREN